MTRVVVYGNCQGGPIGRLLERACPDFEVVRAPPVHTIPADGPEVEALEALMRGADIVLSQPVDAAWGRRGSAHLRQVYARSEWIEFPSIYFGGVFPYLQYLRIGGGKSLQGPLGDYHDQRIVSAWEAGLSEADAVARLAAADVEYCRERFHAALAESRRREQGLPIQVMDHVERHVAGARTFHTFNHPTNAVMWEVVMQFLRLVSARMQVPGPPQNQYLDHVSAAVPAELAEAAGVAATDPRYCLARREIAPAELVREFYRAYAATPDFAAIVAANRLAGR